MKIRKISGSYNHDGTWALHVDVIEPDDSNMFPDGIQKTYYLPKVKMSTPPSGDTYVSSGVFVIDCEA